MWSLECPTSQSLGKVFELNWKSFTLALMFSTSLRPSPSLIPLPITIRIVLPSWWAVDWKNVTRRFDYWRSVVFIILIAFLKCVLIESFLKIFGQFITISANYKMSTFRASFKPLQNQGLSLHYKQNQSETIIKCTKPSPSNFPESQTGLYLDISLRENSKN